MKKTLLLLLILSFVSFGLFAETAFWVGPDSVSSPVDNSLFSAYTDLYEKGSELYVTSQWSTVIVTVEGSCPDSNEGRDFGLTKAALEELGLWGSGHSLVSVKLKKGAVSEGDKREKEDSGWYVFHLEGVEKENAYNIYKALVRKGFKPITEISEDGLWNFSLPYILKYERDEKRGIIQSLGLTIKAEENDYNPYLD